MSHMVHMIWIRSLVHVFLGAQNDQVRSSLQESQRRAQLEFNSRLDEESALEEAIRRSLD